jgi:hypothetical protein
MVGARYTSRKRNRIDLTIKALYPCCGGRAVLHCNKISPRERFDRVCPGCGREFVVDRRTGKVTDKFRIDFIEWSWGDQRSDRGG